MKQKVWKVDRLNRISIPVMYRERIGIKEGEEVNITIEYGKIIIRKFERNKVKENPCIGAIRMLDGLGRVCIPIELIDVCEIRIGKVTLNMVDDKIEIFQ